MTQSSPYSNVPFNYPNGITNAAGNRVNRNYWDYFSQYSDAQSILKALQNASLLDASQPPNQLTTPLKITVDQLSIIDGIEAGLDGEYIETTPYDSNNIPETYVTAWHIHGTIVVDGITFLLDEYVGDLVKRYTVPDQGDYDEQGTSEVIKIMLLPNVSNGTIGLAEATYRA